MVRTTSYDCVMSAHGYTFCVKLVADRARFPGHWRDDRCPRCNRCWWQQVSDLWPWVVVFVCLFLWLEGKLKYKLLNIIHKLKSRVVYMTLYMIVWLVYIREIEIRYILKLKHVWVNWNNTPNMIGELKTSWNAMVNWNYCLEHGRVRAVPALDTDASFNFSYRDRNENSSENALSKFTI